MPHTFPTRKLSANEVADPDVLNEQFQPLAHKLGGRVNEQDISATVKSGLSVSAGAYYGAHQIKKASSPALTRGGGAYYANFSAATGDPSATVKDSASWQSLQDDGSTPTMALTKTCGEGDILVMIAQNQHFACNAATPTEAADVNAPVKLQYALRLDGAVISETVTGAVVYPDPPPQEWYRAERSSGANDFDFRHIQYVQNTVGIPQSVAPSRMIWTTKVSSGSHTVDVVARRIPMSDYKIDTDGDGTTVKVFNRRLAILRIKGFSPYSGGIPSVSLTPFEDGQVLDATDITTNGFTALQTTINDLQSAHIERGALRNEHLPSVVYDPKVTFITPGSPTAAITGEYPGYGTNGAGWSVVADGGTNLRITPTAASWDLSTNHGLFVVLANVQVAYVKWTGGAAPSNDPRAIVILALRMTNANGDVTVLGETEVYVNSHNADNEATEDIANIEFDVPLTWVVDTDSLSAFDKQITRIEVVASVWDAAAGSSPPDVEAKCQQGCIFGFGLKGVHLA